MEVQEHQIHNLLHTLAQVAVVPAKLELLAAAVLKVMADMVD
jgi:hypothetical protein